ncbi:hypothetical protein C0992_011083 [Termitomyces sp. T32_za158]|nr:hypothetical protein C0992_011083 [Termitomyces sp. T32_za158]
MENGQYKPYPGPTPNYQGFEGYVPEQAAPPPAYDQKPPDEAGAIIFTVFALFAILSYFGFRSRIPLASLLLQVVMDVSKHHISVYLVAFVALLLQAALAV